MSSTNVVSQKRDESALALASPAEAFFEDRSLGKGLGEGSLSLSLLSLMHHERTKVATAP